jgi:hypothetical protein
VSPYAPHEEEDEGYLAARSGGGLAGNPYPKGTIRYEEWRRGWQIQRDERRVEQDEGFLAGAAGQSLSENPHPRGTIRHDQWRRGWRMKQDQAKRASRLGAALATGAPQDDTGEEVWSRGRERGGVGRS